jgi:hypothetical protein
MNIENYQSTITVNKPLEIAFSAVTTRISEWWAKNVKGNSSNIHDVFTVYFGKTFGTFKVVDLVPNKRIVWYTIDCCLDIFQNKELWKYSTLVWDFVEDKDSTTINMTHIGLFPGKECYEDCKLGWDFYIKESLFTLLVKGKGFPGTGIRARIINNDKIYEGVMYSKEDPVPEIPNNYLIVDIKEAVGEQIISVYSVNRKDNERFEINSFNGNYYMILENVPVKGKIQPLEDLQTFFKL